MRIIMHLAASFDNKQCRSLPRLKRYEMDGCQLSMKDSSLVFHEFPHVKLPCQRHSLESSGEKFLNWLLSWSIPEENESLPFSFQRIQQRSKFPNLTSTGTGERVPEPVLNCLIRTFRFTLRTLQYDGVISLEEEIWQIANTEFILTLSTFLDKN